MIKNDPVELALSMGLYGNISSGNIFSIISSVPGIDSPFSMGYSDLVDNIASYKGTTNWGESQVWLA